jgi:hypothetical protein
MLPLLATLLAATGAADATPMSTEAQVRELCSALRDSGVMLETDPAAAAAARRDKQRAYREALSRVYRVEVPSNGFSFGQYRLEQQELELDGSRPLRAVGGALSLDLDGADEVAFHASPDQVKTWDGAKRAGALSLVVVFQPTGGRCAGNPAAGIFRLDGAPVRWELRSGSAAVAASDEDGYPIDAKPGQAHVLKVQRVALESDPTGQPPPGGRLASVQPELDRCAQQAHRSGSLVVTFAVQGGRVHDPQVIMDAVRDDQVSSCVARALANAPIEGPAGRGTASLALQ